MRHFQNILYVGDPDGPAACLLERAATLAEANQARLAVVWLLADPRPATSQLEPKTSLGTTPTAGGGSLQQRLEALVAPLRDRVEIETGFLSGPPSISVIREVQRGGHDLVLKCASAGGLMNRLLGSEDLDLLRHCPCPVWLCKPDSPSRYRRILVAVDPDDTYPEDELASRRELNLRLLELAASVALAEFAELHVVHVWSAVGETAMRGSFLTVPEEQIHDYVNNEQMRRLRLMDRLMVEITDRLGEDTLAYLRPIRHLPKGWARDEIPNLAERIEADLVVLGTVARGGIPGLLMGNTAELLLHRLHCSILALKPKGFVTPVTL